MEMYMSLTDVMNNVINPKIIAKYVEKDGKYSIPSLF